MIRKMLNASRLRDEVSRRIHRIHEVVEDGVKIHVPRPQLQEPDETGCNWTMKHFGNAAGHERDIAAVLKAVRAEYNLSGEAKIPDNPFGDMPGN
ncbi:hypothetical protein PI87_24290 [Ralstonia sp. A12]|uniref:hypothetical protein n=1 Tax=Ralstonia sp. A12 TaxID=1217052 RepID=UPI000575BD32|nr:hypothetical protein [Ralstonia sp. A12]KHK49642.1 hypothetical protein PI87_24290 [Ralstonia sp. A12]